MDAIREIAEEVRAEYFDPGVRADGLCYLLSKKLMERLRDHGFNAKFIDGVFVTTDFDCRHCWVEISGFIIDITASQFTEIVDDVLITTYKEHTQYVHN